MLGVIKSFCVQKNTDSTITIFSFIDHGTRIPLQQCETLWEKNE